MSKKPWTIASARQQLTKLVGMAAHEPQHVYRREHLVATVVSPALAHELLQQERPSLARKFAELQQLCAEDDYALTVPERTDRGNPLAPRRSSRSGGPSRPRRR